MVKDACSTIVIKRSVLIVALFLMISQVQGEIPPHIDPGNVTRSDSDLIERQALIINELLSHWSGIFISLDKGDIKSAQDNFEQYLDILQQNNNILIEIKGDAYKELNENAHTLNLTMDQIEKLRSLYEEGKIAYQSNQTQKAVQIAIESRGIIDDLNSYQRKFIMDAVEQFPGINITDYQAGSSNYDAVLKNLKTRWRAVELTLFDDSMISLTVHPKVAQIGHVIYLDGAVTRPRNKTGVKNAVVVIKINGTTDTTLLTDENGNYNVTYTIPYKKQGRYPIDVEFVPHKEPLISSYASSYFEILPTNTSITISAQPDTVEFNDTVQISGSLVIEPDLILSGAKIALSLDDKILDYTYTDEIGNYHFILKVPAIHEGIHSLKAEYLPNDEPLNRAGNNSIITVIPTNTSIQLSSQGTVHQESYLNVSWSVITKKGFLLKDPDITISLDDKEIGSALINSGDFYFSYLIDRTVQKGKHNLTIKYAGASPFLPSERTNSIDILEPESNYNILFLLGLIGIMISAFYIRKDRSLHNKIESFTSSLRSRSEPAPKPEPIPTFNEEETIQEMIKTEEPGSEEKRVQEKENPRINKIQERSFPEIEELIAKSNYDTSISLSHSIIKTMISEKVKIDNGKYLTHREFFDRVKDAIPLINDEMKEITEMYELAMYSGIDARKEHAVRALGSVKNISSKLM